MADFEVRPITSDVTEADDGWSTDYYQLPANAKEMQDLIEHREMNFAMGNIFKACYRYGHKRNTSQEYDLNKIIWYATRELARVRKNNGRT